jgi:hypothetical protein
MRQGEDLPERVRRVSHIPWKRALDRSADGDETVNNQPVAYISASERARLLAGQTAVVMPAQEHDDPAESLCFVEPRKRRGIGVWLQRAIKVKFRFYTTNYLAWHLLPTIRFGVYSSSKGFFLALTFLKADALISFEWSE